MSAPLFCRPITSKQRKPLGRIIELRGAVATGKTFIAHALEAHLRELGFRAVWLGDIVLRASTRREIERECLANDYVLLVVVKIVRGAPLEPFQIITTELTPGSSFLAKP